jgi:hypothetical protein
MIERKKSLKKNNTKGKLPAKKSLLKKKIIKKTKFMGSGLDLIFGLIYLASKYKNLDIPFKFKSSYGYKRNDFMNYGIRFDCEYYDNTQSLIYPIYEKKFYDLIKKSKKRFVGIFLYIKWSCNENDAHFNAILFDRKHKKVERFEPYTKFNEKKYFSVTNRFDDLFSKSIKKNLDYEYILPNSFCPKLGFQQKEENNILSVFTPSTVGNFNLDTDPGGFCGSWVLYYLNLRIANPNIESDKLLKDIYKYLNSDKHSFRTFIRNYSNFIYKERSKLLKEYNKGSNEDYTRLHTFLENKFSVLINRSKSLNIKKN